MGADRKQSLTERRRTEAFAGFFGQGPDVQIGIGDDAAVLRSDSRPSVVCVDPVVESVHFAPDAPLRSVGRKAVARNLSDLAAMGATPRAVLVSILLPESLSRGREQSLYRGLKEESERFGASVVGGDLSSSPGPLVVTVTAIGHLENAALTRTGARSGDTLHLTGPVGGSLLGRHLKIEPRISEGQWLARRPEIGGALDVSDGVLLDLWTMLRASGVPGAELDLSALPVHRDAKRASKADGRSAIEHALGDGEDHELLFTVRQGHRLGRGGPLSPEARRPFGRLIDEPGLFAIHEDGTRSELRPSGYQHGGGPR